MNRGSIASADAVVAGRELGRGFDDSADAVVVGSGAGGMVVGTLLAEAGKRVLLLEEGPFWSPQQYAQMSPSQALRNMWREGGMLAALGIGPTPVMAVAVGRCVGGSSVLTGGVCFRIPSEVHDHWEHNLGLSQLGERFLEPAYADVERRTQVAEVTPDLYSTATRRFVAGAASLGIHLRPIRRNVVGCQGSAVCNSGCPVGAKRSVDIAYLPSAIRHGARLVSNALVERVLVRAGVAAGVEGHLLDARNRRSHSFRVRAPLVVVACGTLHTPMLLSRSRVGVSGHALGRHVTLHPALRVAAEFPDPVDGHQGAMQAVASDHFASEGLTVVGVHPPLNVLAAALPGFGPAHRDRVRGLRCVGTIGGLVRDEGRGVLRAGLGREPILSYEMAPKDLSRLRRLISVLGEIAFAAGARLVYPPVFGVSGVRNLVELRRLEHQPLDARRIECMAFHPLGSARMGLSSEESVVSMSGQCHEVRGLYVADGSVLPTSVGVNSQVPVMAMATRIAWGICADSRAGPAARSRGRRREGAC